MTEAQEQAIERIRSRGCSITGTVLDLHGRILRVGFESTATGRDRLALIAPDGRRLSTENTYSYR